MVAVHRTEPSRLAGQGGETMSDTTTDRCSCGCGDATEASEATEVSTCKCDCCGDATK